MFVRANASMDRVRLEAERDLLAKELAHRMKNILTLAHIVVEQSLRGVEGVDEERSAIDGRSRALSAARDVPTESREKEADIRSVVSAALAPHLSNEDRVVMTGPLLDLRSRQMPGPTLAFHELATNAAKYGPFRTRTAGSRERGASTAMPSGSAGRSVGVRGGSRPPQRGLGSTILQRTAGGYIDGQPTLHYDPDGVRFELEGSLG